MDGLTNRPQPDNASKDALEHAWSWLSLHAAQRMQSFNFFLIATAFLVAAYGAVIEKHPILAVGIAVLGAWISLWFNRLERRTRQLVKAGEAVLKRCQQRLAELTEIPELTILEHVETKVPGSSSYAKVINVIQWSLFAGFLVGAAYAARIILVRWGA